MKKSKLTKMQRQLKSRRKKWTKVERQENDVKNKKRAEALARELKKLHGH